MTTGYELYANVADGSNAVVVDQNGRLPATKYSFTPPTTEALDAADAYEMSTMELKAEDVAKNRAVRSTAGQLAICGRGVSFTRGENRFLRTGDAVFDAVVDYITQPQSLFRHLKIIGAAQSGFYTSGGYSGTYKYAKAAFGPYRGGTMTPTEIWSAFLGVDISGLVVSENETSGTNAGGWPGSVISSLQVSHELHDDECVILDAVVHDGAVALLRLASVMIRHKELARIVKSVRVATMWKQLANSGVTTYPANWFESIEIGKALLLANDFAQMVKAGNAHTLYLDTTVASAPTDNFGVKGDNSQWMSFGAGRAVDWYAGTTQAVFTTIRAWTTPEEPLSLIAPTLNYMFTPVGLTNAGVHMFSAYWPALPAFIDRFFFEGDTVIGEQINVDTENVHLWWRPGLLADEPPEFDPLMMSTWSKRAWTVPANPLGLTALWATAKDADYESELLGETFAPADPDNELERVTFKQANTKAKSQVTTVWHRPIERENEPNDMRYVAIADNGIATVYNLLTGVAISTDPVDVDEAIASGVAVTGTDTGLGLFGITRDELDGIKNRFNLLDTEFKEVAYPIDFNPISNPRGRQYAFALNHFARDRSTMNIVFELLGTYMKIFNHSMKRAKQA